MPLLYVCSGGREEVVSLLLDFGLNLHATSATGVLALYLATADTHVAVVETLLKAVDLRVRSAMELKVSADLFEASDHKLRSPHEQEAEIIIA